MKQWRASWKFSAVKVNVIMSRVCPHQWRSALTDLMSYKRIWQEWIKDGNWAAMYLSTLRINPLHL